MAQSSNPSKIAVLVVDDEPLLLMDAADLVGDAGYVVYEASNADRAMRMLEIHDDIRILFTDIDMPGSMDGLKLVHAVRRRWPPVWIIVVSGHTKIVSGDMPENGVFFPKPYSPAGIVAALHQMAGRIVLQ